MANQTKAVKVAVQGCCHGELTAIYNSIPQDVELLLMCGDFQAIRNETDFETMSVPIKYRRLADFHKYYKGELKAPILTVFVGGNHECSSYLKELKYGGWVAPNIYFLGEFGSVWFKGLQIGGLSGIYNHNSFQDNPIEDEKLPYDSRTLRSIYHIKPKNFLKMYLMNHTLDICITHDWPVGIEKHGNEQKLLREKKFFREDINRGTLGSPLNKFLLQYLRPSYWFSGHLHVRFEAKVDYSKEKIDVEEDPQRDDVPGTSDEIQLSMDDDDIPVTNKDEISLDIDDDEKLKEKENKNEINLDMDDFTDDKDEHTTKVIPDKNVESFETGLYISRKRQAAESLSPRKRVKSDPEFTRFLALDKCLPRRKFLEVITVKVREQNHAHPSVDYDGLYLSKRAIAINKVVEDFLLKHGKQFQAIDTYQIAKNPSKFKLVNELAGPVEAELKRLQEESDQKFQILRTDFKTVAPTSDAEAPIPLRYWENNQTAAYCDKFGVYLSPLKWSQK